MKRVIVFDFDETLGSFTQLYKFWHLTKCFFSSELSDDIFFNLLDNNQDFFRPNMLKILNLLKIKKHFGLCSNVMIFTNNNGPKYWVELVKNYINKKNNYEVIDGIIGAFKINNIITEPCRCSNDKSYKDFIKCTKLPKNTKICYFDDQIYNEMVNDNLIYIKLEPYNYNIHYNKLCEKFYNFNKELFIKNKKSLESFNKFIIFNTQNDILKFLNKSRVKKNIELIISNQIIKILTNFLNKNTKKNKVLNSRNKTIKNY